MITRSLLLVLLGLTCLQSFTKAHNSNAPDQCCFSYYEHRIPVRVITDYKVTCRQCSKPGVIFTLKEGRRVCADPSIDWVKKNMKIIDDRLVEVY